MAKLNLGHEFTKGIIKENPVLCLILGTCPTLAITTMASNGLGMGLAATFVLIGSTIYAPSSKASLSGTTVTLPTSTISGTTITLS